MMDQTMVYADLKFATAPPVTTPTCPTAPDEDDSPYENLLLGPVPTVPSPDWQVTQSLQAASREHAAEQGRLSQEVSAREQSLEQTRVELAWARAELQRAWQEGNSSQKELGSRDAELGRARQELTVLQQETQELRGALRDSNSTVNILRACVNTDCCPSGWVLYRSKCLFISMQKKTWFESSEDCRKKSAHLLVQGSWPPWTVPVLSMGAATPQKCGMMMGWADTVGPVDRGICRDAGVAP
ncbi:B-cell differentiation antigen CD72-like [Cuculus canorus]|uniref:B-cell differentiation antigen CD72-like n=1 Tax=Cuculus canorus TaxID=55661 RepID=UPI0023AA8BFD|nr:B-cell differentiation antigen CD72-like [Cuculus canorus]